MDEAALLAVTLVYSPAPRTVEEEALHLPAGSTVRDALGRSAMVARHAIETGAAPVGVWGRRASLDQPLRAGDRVEIYRPLRVDPKVARRERFRQQGARGTGLFARRRPGAKAGY